MISNYSAAAGVIFTIALICFLIVDVPLRTVAYFHLFVRLHISHAWITADN